MAYSRASSVFLILVLFVAAATTSLAHGRLDMNFEGRLCCTTTGNCPGQGVPGVPVEIDCAINGYIETVGQGTTDANGSFNVFVPEINARIPYGGRFSAIPCVATVGLPLNTEVCPALSTTTGLLLSAFRRNGSAGATFRATIVGFVRT
ncbi:hypothetical protein ACP275_10G122900 [Erythranthe tilingii]